MIKNEHSTHKSIMIAIREAATLYLFNRNREKDIPKSVTLEGIKYGVNDNDADTYGSVADLLGANGHQQILYVTTDSFNTGMDNGLTTLINITNTPFGV